MPYMSPRPFPLGAQAYANPIYPEAQANIYSPSLLPLLLPGVESKAEQGYSPLTATTTFRPLRNPTNLPLIPNTEPPPQGSAVSYPMYSNMVATVPDPSTFTKVLNAAQQFNTQSSMALPSGMASALLTPYQTAQNSLQAAQLGGMISPAAPNPRMPLSDRPLRLSSPTAHNTFGIQGSQIPLPNLAMFSSGALSNPSLSAVSGESIVPNAQQLMSVVGVNQLVQMLNKINPTEWNTQTLLSTPRSLVMERLNSLPYGSLLQVFLMLPLEQRANLIMLEGLATTPGEAMMMAQGMYGLVPPTPSVAEGAQLKKRAAETPKPLAV